MLIRHVEHSFCHVDYNNTVSANAVALPVIGRHDTVSIHLISTPYGLCIFVRLQLASFQEPHKVFILNLCAWLEVCHKVFEFCCQIKFLPTEDAYVSHLASLIDKSLCEKIL